MFDHGQTKFLGILALIAIITFLVATFQIKELGPGLIVVLLGILPGFLINLYNLDCVLSDRPCTVWGWIQTISLAIVLLVLLGTSVILLARGKGALTPANKPLLF